MTYTVKLGNYDAIDLMAARPMGYVDVDGISVVPVGAAAPMPVVQIGTPALPTGAATAARQDTQITAEQAILAKLTSDPATQTTLAAILAKIIAAPATEATLAGQSAKLPASLGGKAPAASLSVTPAVLACATVAAGATATAFGATGAAGDYMSHVILEPAATNAGTTTIFNNGTEVYKYTSGTLADLRPIIIPINMLSSGGAWKVTTGASVQARGYGIFT